MRRILHHAHAVVFFVLLLTGFLLHFAILRGPLSAYRLLLIHIHSLAGELFALLVLIYPGMLLWGRIQWWQRKRYRWFTVVSFLAMAGWIGTGWILLQKAQWGPVYTTWAFEIHRWLAYLAVPAVFLHFGLVGRRAWSEPASQSRRRFLGWLTAGSAAGWASFLGWRFWNRNRGQDIRGNAKCDIFYPAPQPAEKSLPPVGGGRRGKFGEYSIVNFLPCLHHDTWQFTIDGLVERPVTFRWEDFVRLPRTVQVSDFHCVEGWSVFDITYEGLKVTELLKISGIRPEARFVKFYSADGRYADALSLEQTLHMPDVMIAMLMDGEPIPRVLGGPARLIVPQMYAYKAVKWVNRIELIDKPYLGYWEFHGFETDAWLGIY